MLIKSLFSCATLLTAATASAHLGVEKVAEKFERPVWVGQPTGINDQLWVIEQVGKIWIIDAKTGARSDKPFLDITADVSRKGNEMGLLGLAFAPDYLTSGRFYVNFTDSNMKTRIVRFTTSKASSAETDPASAEVLFTFDQPYENHNGGWVSFGPDGFLYISTGDGGAGDDPQNRAQDLTTHLGKILRIDVSPAHGYLIPKDNPFIAKANAKSEIYCYGMRNPWRCSFDRKTGDFWIGDVGQNKWEEIDYLAKGKAKGANFGWRLRESDVPNPNDKIAGDNPPGAINPIYVYKHGGGSTEGMSVTGGYVYHGPIRELDGRYVFGDYQNPRVWSFSQKGGKAIDFRDLTDQLKPQSGRINLISAFGEDNAGSLYIIDHTGPIYRIVDK
jgi:glucose/arabinose dehydrogenase